MLQIAFCSRSQIHASSLESWAIIWSWMCTNSVIGLVIFGTCKPIRSVELGTIMQGFTNCVVFDWVWSRITFLFLSKRGIHFLLLLLCCICRRLWLISKRRFARIYLFRLVDDFREWLVCESSFFDCLWHKGNVRYFNYFLVSLLGVF